MIARAGLAIAAAVLALPAVSQSAKLEAAEPPSGWPTGCVRHFELGDTLAHGDSSARMIGYYDRIIHHSGQRHRYFVFFSPQTPDRAAVIAKGKVIGEIVDRSDSGRIPAYFSSQTVLDQSDVDGLQPVGLEYRAVSPEMARLACRS